MGERLVWQGFSTMNLRRSAAFLWFFAEKEGKRVQDWHGSQRAHLRRLFCVVD